MGRMILYGRNFCDCGCLLETLAEQATKKDNYYQFTVTDVKDIDLNRIVREQYEMGNLVTLLTDGKEPKGLLVHNEFLAQFQEGDNLKLGEYTLGPSWSGASSLSIAYSKKSFYFDTTGTGGDVHIPDARLTTRLLDAEKIRAQLAAARRALVRRITVKVHSL